MTTEISPFSVEISDTDLADLTRRLAATRWPDEETTVGTDQPWKQGLPLRVARELTAHWADALRLAPRGRAR